MDARAARLVAVVRDRAAARDAVDDAWRTLFARDAVLAASAAFDLLAGEPRIKPSRRLVVDPGDTVRRAWDLRVAAATALLSSPVAASVFAELRDELAEDADLAADVLATCAPSDGLTSAQVAALAALGA